MALGFYGDQSENSATKAVYHGELPPGSRCCDTVRIPRGLSLATAMTSAAFFPHLEQRIRSASSLSVIFHPTRRARASGSFWGDEPQSQITGTRNCPKQ